MPALVRVKEWLHEWWIADIIKAAGITVVVVNAIFGVGEKYDDVSKWLGWDTCHLYDLSSGVQNKKLLERPCLKGKITFIKWTDTTLEGNNNDRVVAARPNRVLQVVSADGGIVTWGEQSLQQVRDGKEIWDLSPRLYWTAVQGGEAVPTWLLLDQDMDPAERQTTSFVLRRLDVIKPECGGLSATKLRATSVDVLEFALENTAPDSLRAKQSPSIYWRSVPYFCDQDMSSAFRFGPAFGELGFPLAQAVTD